MKLSDKAVGLLRELEYRIDPAAEDDFNGQWEAFLTGKFTGGLFSPVRAVKSARVLPSSNININDAITDYELMLISQLDGVSDALSRDNTALGVRSNYGTGIMTSLFGAEIFTMPRETNTLPTTRSWNDTDRIRETVSRGLPDLYGGFGRRVFEMGEYFAEALADYPKLRRYVAVYHPDTQGPLDIAELLWGCEMFYAFYDEPELVHALLRLITDTYKAFMDKWYKLIPPAEIPGGTEITTHWQLRHRGRILLRDDSAMNLSPELYREFAFKYDSELLDCYGGGAIHFCGRGDHYIETMSGAPGLHGINMSQPHLNDMEKILKNTVDKGIPLLGFSKRAAEKLSERDGGLRGLVHVSR